MLARKIRKEPSFSDLKFSDHPNFPTLYSHAVMQFSNGIKLSVLRRKTGKEAQLEWPEYEVVFRDDPRKDWVYNRSVKYEVMRFDPNSTERFDNEIFTTDTQLIKLIDKVAAIGQTHASASLKKTTVRNKTARKVKKAA